MSRLLFCLCLLLTLVSCRRRNILNPNTDRDGLKMYQIRSDRTDEEIVQFLEPHQVWIAPEATKRNQLLVFLGGTSSAPRLYQAFPQFAASIGYHVVNVAYNNSPSVQVCSGDPARECFERLREETWAGRNTSTRIFINETHSVHNRLLKLVQYMDEISPDEGWDQYVTGDDLQFDRVVVAGHSQGAGLAAYIGRQERVARVIMFSGPNDYSELYEEAADWAEGFYETPVERYYGLLHADDEIIPFSRQYAFWQRLGLIALGDTVLIDDKSAPYDNARALYTRTRPARNVLPLGKYHNAAVVDKYLRKEEGEYVMAEAWRYLLGG
ncbi:MAG: hypothetical protein AAFQ87_12975 [Bacteroidota bacterium]